MRQSNVISSCIKYKNRFLLGATSTTKNLAGLGCLSGKKLRIYKQYTGFYLNFLRDYNGLTVPTNIADDLNLKMLEFSEFDKLYNAYEMFKDVNRVILWRCQQNLPVVKFTCITVKKKKQKKTKKQKKYTVEFKHIKPSVRLAVAIRWLSLINRVITQNLFAGICQTVPEFIVYPTESRFYKLRKKVYSGFVNSV